MKVFLLLTLFVFAFSFNLRKAKQDYDSYVMAVQWSNGYCKVNSCGSKADHVYKNTMTVHGLWPSLKNGKQLKQCTSGVKVKDDGSQLFKDMKQYWPSFAKGNEQFWEHEYNKHGFCMVEEKGWAGYEDYFRFVLDLHIQTYKDIIIRTYPSSAGTTIKVDYKDFVRDVQRVIPNATLKMNCKSNYLTEIYFYLEKDYNPSTNSKFSNSCKTANIIFK